VPEVLLITQEFPPRPGGMARYYADLAAGWGAGFTVIASSDKGQSPVARSGERVIELAGLDADRAHLPVSLWRAWRQLRRCINEQRPDIVLAGNIRTYSTLVRAAARRSPGRWGFFAHGLDILHTANRWRDRRHKRWRWRLLFDASLIVANSRYTAGVVERLGFDAARIAVVSPEADTTRFRPARDRAEVMAERHRLDLPDSGLLTLFVGRLVPRKGIDELFAALALTPEARLVLIGAGDAQPWQAKAAAAGVADRVLFRGSPSDHELPHWYRAADIFAAPSRHHAERGDVEGFGIVFLEAQASGLPVLATRAGGIPEAVDADRTAVLVPPGDVPALAAAWRRLMSDDELRNSLARAGPSGPPLRHGPGSSARLLAAALEQKLR
jgi:glycosyltransferase involved in cell wall biosynthesis